MVRNLASVIGKTMRAGTLVVRLLRNPRVPWKLKLLLPGALLYLLLPFDLFPDIIPVLSFVDDMLVLILTLALFVSLSGSPLERVHRASAPIAPLPQPAPL